jgi:hypothetical protein
MSEDKEGLIELEVLAPRLVRLRFTGLVDEHDAVRAVRDSANAAGRRPYAILCETPKLKGLTPGARKAFANEFGGVPLIAVALVNASMPTRALSTFVVAAINILRRDHRLEIGFHDDAAAARTWLESVLAKTSS